MRFFLLLITSGAVLALPPVSKADTFGSGGNSFEIEFVPISGPTILAPQDFRMAKYEISEQMIDKANALSALEGNPLGITKDTRGPDKPATSISWFEAAKFVNWLNTSTNSSPAYKFDNAGVFQLWAPSDPGYDAANLYRNRRAKYFLPSVDEWYKAAYYDPVAGVFYDYPTGSNTVPDGIDFVGDPSFDAVFFDGGNPLIPNDITDVGIENPFGTFGQGGNVREWIEIAFDRNNNSPDEQRMMRGGSWGDINTLLLAANDGIGWLPSFEGSFVGLRVAAIPEPNPIALIAIGILVSISLIRKNSNCRYF